jgi:hypothetical protein
MLAGFPNIWWIIGVIIIVVGGNLAITAAWGYKHFAWGFPLVLAVLVVVTLEGSWQTELADRSALTAERNAHLGTMAALEAERQSPVSPGHRDRLKVLGPEAGRADQRCMAVPVLRTPTLAPT